MKPALIRGGLLTAGVLTFAACATNGSRYQEQRAEADLASSEISEPMDLEIPELWNPPDTSSELFGGEGELQLDRLLHEVESRNPTLSAMKSPADCESMSIIGSRESRRTQSCCRLRLPSESMITPERSFSVAGTCARRNLCNTSSRAEPVVAECAVPAATFA